MGEAKHREFIQQHVLSELIFDKRQLVEVDPRMKVGECMEVLSKNQILSAPVFDHQRGVYTGIIEIFSIMAHLTFGPSCPALLHTKFDQHYVEEFQEPVCVLEPTHHLESFIEIDRERRIYRALVNQPKSHFEGSCHFKGDGSNFRMISQMDVIKFLLKNSKELGNFVHKTVQQLNLYDPEQPQVVSIKTNESAFLGFQRIREADINGIAVIDAQTGKLVGNLSASDLRGLSAINLIRVMDSVENFLGEKLMAVSCSPQSCLLDIMFQCVDAKIHRIYVVNPQQEPIGVISLSDILRKFIE